MKEDTKTYSHLNPKPSFYACLYPELKQIALEHGYALAIHGSLARDLDLIAVAWNQEVKDHVDMIDEMLKAIGGTMFKSRQPYLNEKPHGRIVYTLSILGDWFVDISVIPPAKL